MPFQSEKQRRYMHANHPEIARRWEHEYGSAVKRDRTKNRRGRKRKATRGNKAD
jgi:hypothetical protein